jgi:hypothetical protein
MGVDVDGILHLKNKHGYEVPIFIPVYECLSVESVYISITLIIIQRVRSKIKRRVRRIGEEDFFLRYYPSRIGGFSLLLRIEYCYKTIMTYDNNLLVLLMCFHITITNNESR